jgi:hypothetical protein
MMNGKMVVETGFNVRRWSFFGKLAGKMPALQSFP